MVSQSATVVRLSFNQQQKPWGIFFQFIYKATTELGASPHRMSQLLVHVQQEFHPDKGRFNASAVSSYLRGQDATKRMRSDFLSLFALGMVADGHSPEAVAHHLQSLVIASEGIASVAPNVLTFDALMGRYLDSLGLTASAPASEVFDRGAVTYQHPMQPSSRTWEKILSRETISLYDLTILSGVLGTAGITAKPISPTELKKLYEQR